MSKEKESWLRGLLRSPKKKCLSSSDNLNDAPHGLSSRDNSTLNRSLLPPKDNLRCSSWSSKASNPALPNPSSVSRYATIGRKKPSQPFQQLCDYYYDLCSDDNASVCSLPLPPREIESWINQSRMGGGGSLSGMIQFRSYSSSLSSKMTKFHTSSFSTIMEENPFAFLDEYEIYPDQLDDPEQHYFLPRQVRDGAWEKWKGLEGSGNYEQLMIPTDEDPQNLKRVPVPLCLKRPIAVKTKGACVTGSDINSPYF